MITSTTIAAVVVLLHWIPVLCESFEIVEPVPIKRRSSQTNCGGLDHLQRTGERCGICGDPFTGNTIKNVSDLFSNVTSHKTSVSANSNLRIHVKVDYFRPAWLEFRICKLNDHAAIEQECFNRQILNINNVNRTRIYVSEDDIRSNRTYTFSVRIPYYVTCNSCILQVKYRTLDTWGVD
ncbi:hypothetical protein ACOME3_002634 [Neoechinorhynchus agilis]